ncbi:MAG TPA: aspartate aminotransferase family protein [Actinomycetota bacterium]|nr:aspartate aminotransferase family protein [Actinomycetota bacterium]
MDNDNSLEQAARRHLWQHFNQPPGPDTPSPLIIERGEGSYVWDTSGRRYLDGMAGQYAVQVGHGRTQLSEAAARQASELAFFPLWTNLHPAAARLAERIAGLAPGDLNRVFFTTGGGESVESAWKLAHQYFALRGEPQRTRVIAREMGYHGTTLGALSAGGVKSMREPFLPLLNDQSSHVATTNRRHCNMCAGHPACTLACADEIEQEVLRLGPETVAAVFLEPVQVIGGCLMPAQGYFARVREICDRYGALLVSEEAICAFGRLGEWFGCTRFGFLPDMATFAKGVTSGYAPLGGVVISDRIAEAFVDAGTSFSHGITFGGHPMCCAVALANIDLMEREGLNQRVRQLEPEFRSRLEGLLDHPLIAEVRGLGYFYALEMGRDGEPLSDDERSWLTGEFLSRRLPALGLLCRVDDTGNPVIQLAPPLVAGPPEFEEIERILRQALDDAWSHIESGNLELVDRETKGMPAATG